MSLFISDVVLYGRIFLTYWAFGRSYYFVSNWNNLHLPYHPEEHILTASLIAYWDNVTITRKWQTQESLNNEDETNSNNNLFTKVKIYLTSWEFLTKATSLNPEDSAFEVYSEDTTAAVRWTIFTVKYDSYTTTIAVIEWIVQAQANDNSIESLQEIESWSDNIKEIKQWESIKSKDSQ